MCVCCDALARNLLSMAEVVNLWVWLPFHFVSRFTSTHHVIPPDFAVAVFTSFRVTKHVLSLASVRGGGVRAMNSVILTKWRIALSIDIGVLENH